MHISIEQVSRTATRLAGACCVLLGVLVLVGWYGDVPFIVRLGSDLPAIQAVTALGFLVAGLALTLGTRAPALRIICALVLMALGAATLVSFLLHLPSFLNPLLRVPSIGDGTIPPRLMAPNSALGFCFVGVGLLLAGRERTAVAAVATGLLGGGAAALGGQDVVRFIGEAAGRWSDIGQQMAFQTAVGFLVVGLALMLEARRLVPPTEPARMKRALFAGGLGLAATLIAGHVIRSHQIETVQSTTRTVGVVLARELEATARYDAEGANGSEFWLEAALPGTAPGYGLEVRLPGQPPFRRGTDRPPEDASYMQLVPVRLAGQQATLALWPSRELLDQSRRPLALAVLIMGSALALLLAVSIQAGETALTRAQRLETALTSLAAEARERQRAEIALAASEARLHESRKMEAVARLAGGMAHEFNNLLSVIRGYTQLLSATGDDVERESFAFEIDRASERGAVLTRRLLTVSARHAFQPQILDLAATVRAVLGRVTELLGERIVLQIETEAWGDGRVSVDPEQLEQAILTLVRNARDAMPAGGTLEVGVRRRTIEATSAAALGVTPGLFVEIRVADQGKGLQPDELSGIFEPFGGGSRPESGSGLGLAMLYGFVRQSGGAVDVSSTPGRGTTFRILFPSAAEVARAEQQVPQRSSEPRTGLVLVVEDEDALRRLVERLLRRAGYDVIPARDGAEALRHTQERSDAVDLLLTDVVMPELGGVELAGALRSQRPGLPVLFMSGYTDAVMDASAPLSPGRTAFIQKPFATGELLAAVDALIAPPATRQDEALSAA